MSKNLKDGYDVGYRRPPKDTRFKKGQPSPNPNGRPKKEASISAAIRECLGEDVSVTTKDGTKQTMPAAKAIGKKVVGQAASGDVNSQRMLLALEKGDAARRPDAPEQVALDPEADAADQRLTLYLADLMHITAGCGMFDNDEEGKTVPSDIGAPLMRLHSDLMGSQIRTVADYKEARRNALAKTTEAFDTYALGLLRYHQKNVQKSDLE